MVVVIDYGMGNLRSILYKLRKFNIDAKVSSGVGEIMSADRLILPGVGHFAKGMENLKNSGMADALNKKVLEEKTPIMGICLGVQLFTRHSEEGDADGLGWIDAETVRFNFDGEENKRRVPHVGWNLVNFKKDSKYHVEFPEDKRFYFTHSYYIKSHDPECVAGTTFYGREFVSVIEKGNIFGTQFHPEKSHRDAFAIIKNFCGKEAGEKC